MTTHFLSEANKLKNVQLYLEKNDNLANYLLKCGAEANIDYFSDLETERKSDVDKITVELRSIWELLCSRKKLLHEGNLNSLDLRFFQEKMSQLQESILNLKTKLSTNLEKLKDQENNIIEIMELFNQKLTEWSKTVKISSNFSLSLSKNTATYNDRYKEVLEFMDFVDKSNGHENGWSSGDHQQFLKLRRKYKNTEELAINLNKIFPDITIEEVRQHDAWFRKYMFFRNKKDEALERWRQDKKENILQKVKENDTPRVKSETTHLKQENEDVHAKIALWKAEKDAKRRQENIYEQMKLEKKKLSEAYKKRFDSQVKQEVTKWRQAKMEREQNEKVRKEMEEYYQKRIRAATANRLIRQFQTQDDLFIARVRLTKLREENKSKKRSKSSQLVQRDPERILKPTKQWLLRTTKDNFINEVSTYVPNVRKIPKLKVPDWRRNTNLTN